MNADAGRYPSFVNNQPYRISTVRYYGDGQEEADYSGSPTRNIEIDGWGLFLWAARQYVDASMDTAWLASTTKKGDSVYDARPRCLLYALFLERHLAKDGGE